MAAISLTVMCPMGSDPGDKFTVETEFGDMEFIVPEGVDYGDDIVVEVQPPGTIEPVPVPEPEPQPVAMPATRGRSQTMPTGMPQTMRRAGAMGTPMRERRRSSIQMQQSLAMLETMFTDLKGDVASTSQESKANLHLVEQARRMSMAKAQQTALLGQDKELDAMLQELDEAEEGDEGNAMTLTLAEEEPEPEPRPISFFTGALVVTAATKWAHLSPSSLGISASPREEEDEEEGRESPSPLEAAADPDGLSAWEQEAELAAELAAEEDELRRLEHEEEVAREQTARQAKRKKQEQKRRKAAAARAEAEAAAARQAEAVAAREIKQAAEAERRDAERRERLRKDKQKRERREREQRAAAASAAAIREQEEQKAVAELEAAEAKRREEQQRRDSARKAEAKQRRRAKAQREAAKAAAAEADAKRREEQERNAAAAAATERPSRTGSAGLTRAAEAALASRLSAQRVLPSEEMSPQGTCHGSPSQRRAQREHAARLATRSNPSDVIEEAEPPRGAATAGFWDAFVARNDKLLEDRDELHRERMLEICLARQSDISKEEKAELKELIELNPKEFAEFLATSTQFERDWKKSWRTGDRTDGTATATSRGWNSDGISPVAAKNVYRHAPVGMSHHGTRTLKEVGMRVFKVAAPKIAVRSHCTLDSPKVGSLVQGDTIIVTESRRIRVNVEGTVSGDDDDALSMSDTSVVERLHCLSGWVSATSAASGATLLEEDQNATAGTQLVSGMQQLESRMRPVKKPQASINHFVARQERAAEVAAQKRAAAESTELAEMTSPNRRTYKKAVEVSESLLKPTKSFEALLQQREARQQQQAIEAAREQAWLSPSSSPSRSTAPAESPNSSPVAVAPSQLEDSALAPLSLPFREQNEVLSPPPLTMPAKQERKHLFDRIDVHAKGRLALAEIDKAAEDGLLGSALGCPTFSHKPALMRAYHAADIKSDSAIGRAEFSKLLSFLVYFNNLSGQFEEIGSDHDRRLTVGEFVSGCGKLGLDLTAEEAEREFKVCDAGASGTVLFGDFCRWAATWSGGHLAFA